MVADVRLYMYIYVLEKPSYHYLSCLGSLWATMATYIYK